MGSIHNGVLVTMVVDGRAGMGLCLHHWTTWLGLAGLVEDF